MQKSTAILIFAKEPIAGKVKTRLAATLPKYYPLPEQFACEVYKACLYDLFATLTKLPFHNIVYLSPESNSDFFSQFSPEAIKIQQGNDLGKRMENTFLTMLPTYKKVLLIGSDSPQLQEETFITATKALDTHDCVIGPAVDGGYYLIGFTQSGFINCFDGIAWSTSSVLAQTLNALTTQKTFLLEPHQDIDTFTDLITLFASKKCPMTLKSFLSKEAQSDSYDINT